jgi:hypothetical protein
MCPQPETSQEYLRPWKGLFYLSSATFEAFSARESSLARRIAHVNSYVRTASKKKSHQDQTPCG